MEQIPTRTEKIKRERDILRRLRKGVTPTTLIQYCEEKYHMTHQYAYNEVYRINHALKTSTKDLADEVAEYIKTTLINEIEECADEDDRKNKLRALELLAKVCKVGESDNKIDLNVNFDFQTD